MICTVDITSKCNLSCDYCYQDTSGELSIDRLISLANDVMYDSFEIGGGEPFLHKDCLKFMGYLLGKNKKVHISTNATFIPKEFYDFNSEKIYVQVSLPANDEVTFEKVTSRKLYSQVISNLTNLKKFCTYQNLSINFVAYEKNKDSVPFNIAKNFDVPISVSLCQPAGFGKKCDLLNGDQIYNMSLNILKAKLEGVKISSVLLPKKMNNLKFSYSTYCPILAKQYGFDLEEGCTAGISKIYIAPDNTIHNCEWISLLNPEGS